MAYIHKIVIGDWSDDGHCRKDIFEFECSHDEQAIKKAYFDFMNKFKIALHLHTELGKYNEIVSVLDKYSDNFINENICNRLREAGIDLDKTGAYECDTNIGAYSFEPKHVANLFMEMVKTQISDFSYKYIEPKKPINGFWSDDFNLTFGYGVYE